MPFSSGRESVSGMINVFAGTWFRGRRRVDDVSFNESLPPFLLLFTFSACFFLLVFFRNFFNFIFSVLKRDSHAGQSSVAEGSRFLDFSPLEKPVDDVQISQPVMFVLTL